MLKSPIARLTSSKMRRPPISFFREEIAENHDLTLLAGNYCTLKESPFSIPYLGYYFDVHRKRELLIQYRDCRQQENPSRSFLTLFSNLNREINQLLSQVAEVFQKIISSSEKSFFCKIEQITQLLELLQRQLTQMEFKYYLLQKMSKFDDDATDIKVRLCAEVKETLLNTIEGSISYFVQILYVHNVGDTEKYDFPEAQKIWHKLFSFFESIRNSTVLSEIIQNSRIATSDVFYDLLFFSYKRASKNWKHPISIPYVQEIANQHLFSLMFSHEIIEKVCPFKNQLLYTAANIRLADAYGFTDNCEFYLKNSCDYIELLLGSLLQNADISCKAPVSDKQLTILAPGMPQLKELESRINIIARYHGELIWFFKNPLFILAHKGKRFFDTLQSILENQEALIAQKREEIIRMKAPHKNKTKPIVKAIQPTSRPEIKTANLPLANLMEKVESKTSVYDRPTIRISPEEQMLIKQHKQQCYAESKQHAASATSISEESDTFNFNFYYYAKPIEARLDHAICTKAMGEQSFCQVLPRLNALLARGKVTGDEGQGIKVVSHSEKILLGFTQTSHWFKLKFLGNLADRYHIYGELFIKDGRGKVVFNHVEIGNVHEHSNRIYHPPLCFAVDFHLTEESDPDSHLSGSVENFKAS